MVNLWSRSRCWLPRISHTFSNIVKWGEIHDTSSQIDAKFRDSPWIWHLFDPPDTMSGGFSALAEACSHRLLLLNAFVVRFLFLSLSDWMISKKLSYFLVSATVTCIKDVLTRLQKKLVNIRSNCTNIQVNLKHYYWPLLNWRCGATYRETIILSVKYYGV